MTDTQIADSKPLPATEYSGELRLTLPKTLHRKLTEAANREGVDLNQYVVALLSEQNALNAIHTVQARLDEINQQLQPNTTTNQRESPLNQFREMRERDQRARAKRVAYDNRYIENWESGLND